MIHRLFARRLGAALCIASYTALCTDALAANLSAAGEPYFLTTRGTKVDTIVRDIGANYGVPVMVSEDVDDTFAGTLRGASAAQLLDTLARTSSIAWYYDGTVLHVYKTSEVKNEVLAPAHLSAAELASWLREAGALDSPWCSVRTVKQFNALEVFGVPACLDRLTKLSKHLDQNLATQRQREEVVQIFPLRYASVSDTSYTYRNQQVVVPGVVSELREMSRTRSLPFATQGAARPVAAAPLTLAAPGDNALATTSDASVASTDSAAQPGIAADGTPTFAADVRNNAVIVRDKKANLPLYAELIAQLDKRPEQIEISVAIIDVDASNLANLGVNFGGSVRFGGGKIEFNQQNGSQGDAPHDSFSTVIGSTGDFFVRINALEQTSKAKVLSRPSVVTLNNVQAVLDHSITFYTKLQGEYSGRLEGVPAGSLMRVTPRIIDDNGVREVMLTLDVQDGQQSAPLNRVENLPQIKNSSITTQAVLKPGQSLLLGGFVQDKQHEGRSKTPWLGDLPGIGWLFKSDSKETRSVVRLFLIKAEPFQVTQP